MKNILFALLFLIPLRGTSQVVIMKDTIPEKEIASGTNAIPPSHSIYMLPSNYFPEKIKEKYSCPIEITESFVISNEIGEPIAVIKYLNVTDKLIDGVEFDIACFDNFERKVNQIRGNNISGGISQDNLESGYEITNQWTLHLQENTTHIKPKVTKVHFSDGTIWPSLKTKKKA